MMNWCSAFFLMLVLRLSEHRANTSDGCYIVEKKDFVSTKDHLNGRLSRIYRCRHENAAIWAKDSERARGLSSLAPATLQLPLR